MMLSLSTILHLVYLSPISAAVVGEVSFDSLPKIKIDSENTILIDGHLSKGKKLKEGNGSSLKLNLICDKHFKHLESYYTCQTIKIEEF